MRFHPLLPSTELFDGFKRVFEVAGQRILLIQETGMLFAIEDKCGHFGVSLEKGAVCAGGIRCGVHGVEFDLSSGLVRHSTVEQCDPVRCFTVVRRAGLVGVAF